MPNSGPGSAPTPGHKYVRRWWGGDKWEYEYPGEGSGHQPHGPVGFGSNDDPTRSHVIELHPSTPQGASPDQAYNHSMDQYLQANGKIHELANPADPNNPLKVQVYVTAQGGRKLRVLTADGKKGQDFPNRGSLEKWYRGSIQAKRIADPNGQPWLDVVPNVGQVEKGDLNPPKSKDKMWIIRPSEGANPEFLRQIGRGELYKPTAESAAKQIEQWRQNIAQVQGSRAPEVAPVAPPQAAAPPVALPQQPAAPVADAAPPAAPPQAAAPAPQGAAPVHPSGKMFRGMAGLSSDKLAKLLGAAPPRGGAGVVDVGNLSSRQHNYWTSRPEIAAGVYAHSNAKPADYDPHGYDVMVAANHPQGVAPSGSVGQVLFGSDQAQHQALQGGRIAFVPASMPQEQKQQKLMEMLQADRNMAPAKLAQNNAIDADLAKPVPDAAGQDAAALQAGQDPKAPTSKPGTVSYALENGQYKYKLDPELKPVLDVSPQEKDKLIEAVAKEYWGRMITLADKFTQSRWFSDTSNPDVKREWMRRFIGADIPDTKGVTPPVVGLDKDHPMYQRLSRALDKYQPGRGIKLSGYLAGAKGQMYWGMMDMYQRLTSGVNQAATDEITNDEGGKASRWEKTPVSQEQEEGSAHLRDVDSLSTSLNNWRKEQASNLELISQRVPNANREYIQKLQQILPKVNNQEAVDQYAAIMHKLGWGEYLSDFGKSFEVLKELYAVVKLREELRK